MLSSRTIAMATGAVGAAGVAGFAVFNQPAAISPPIEKEGYEVCLKTPLTLFDGAVAKCYSKAALADLNDAAVAASDGTPVTLTLTPPGDGEVAAIATCRQWREKVFDGWFALSGAEMRREAYYIRACGLLDALAEAQASTESHFVDGAPAESEMAALGKTMTFGDAPAQLSVTVARPGPAEWRITSGTIAIAMQELANADFDNDGIEEILAFASLSPVGGTATASDVGLLEKDGPEMALIFSPMEFSRDEAAAAGG